MGITQSDPKMASMPPTRIRIPPSSYWAFLPAEATAAGAVASWAPHFGQYAEPSGACVPHLLQKTNNSPPDDQSKTAACILGSASMDSTMSIWRD